MTSLSEVKLRHDLAAAHAQIAALARTHQEVCVERDALRAERDAARAALGPAWAHGTLVESIKRKCRWLESMVGNVEKSQ